VTTAVGYAGGFTPNANYREVCTGQTGHAEAVLIAYDPKRISYEELLKAFWENHDPTQAMRQGNDVGTQYRSLIQVSDDEERRIAEASRDAYQEMLTKAGYGQIMTEISERTPFYYAEDYHQQYLDKVPNGYCPNHATGVKLPDDFKVPSLQYID
jgi:peptide-methionine (S)-S-oxide reductase